MKALFIFFIALFSYGYELNLTKGWHLEGALKSFDARILRRCGAIVWRYEDGNWSYDSAFYTTSYKKLKYLKKAQGFWILADKECLQVVGLERGVSWYWQLNGELKKDKEAKVYDIDLFDSSKEDIKTLKKRGKVVICYFSAGSYEDWREDSKLFSKDDIGKPLDGWDGEYWLNIKSPKVRSIMQRRLDLAKSKGCDGVEPDNVDVYLHDSGFDITSKEQLEYNIFLANEAHKRGLLVGLKNDLAQIKKLAIFFDFAVNEECFEYNECGLYKPFIALDKAVFNAEYKAYSKSEKEKICHQAKILGISTIFVNYELDGSFYQACD